MECIEKREWSTLVIDCILDRYSFYSSVHITRHDIDITWGFRVGTVKCVSLTYEAPKCVYSLLHTNIQTQSVSLKYYYFMF